MSCRASSFEMAGYRRSFSLDTARAAIKFRETSRRINRGELSSKHSLYELGTTGLTLQKREKEEIEEKIRRTSWKREIETKL